MPPNILLVVLDAARRDAIECYDAAARTPTIAALARDGHHLPRAYATSSWTLPSHASMFTGLLPRTLGLGQPPDGTAASVRPILAGVSERLLSRVLGTAGYTCHGFSANAWASQHAGFDIGFDSFAYAPSARTPALTRGGQRERLAWAREGLRGTGDDGAAELGRQLRQAIAGWAGTPTFWFVNLVECHSPYLPPRPWNDLPAAERVRAAFDSQRYMNFESICRHIAGELTIPGESMQRMRHLYARSVSYMDDWLAGILDSLSQRRILDETLVIVVSDHGENFGEDGLIAHGFGLNQPLIHVPLVMAGPGAVDTADVFSLAELPRVIAQAAGIAEHPWRTRAMPDGIAVAQYQALAAPDDPKIRAFAAKWGIDAAGVSRVSTGLDCATDGEHKLVVRDGVRSYYDLRCDPDGSRPLGPDAVDPALAARLAAALEEAAAQPRSTPTSGGAAPDASADELAALEQQMKLLGYM
jgi:arylsulfatase A-like enzyme